MFRLVSRLRLRRLPAIIELNMDVDDRSEESRWGEIQRSLRAQVIDTDDDDAGADDVISSQRQSHSPPYPIIYPLSPSSKFGHPEATFGGLDISFPNPNDSPTPSPPSTTPLTAVASYVVLDSSLSHILHENHTPNTSPLPTYIAGFLSFRELHLVVPLVSSSPVSPTVLMVDGNGLLHPMRFGSACHIGVSLGVPTVGVGKTLHEFLPGVTIQEVKRRFASAKREWAAAATEERAVPDGAVVLLGCLVGGVRDESGEEASDGRGDEATCDTAAEDVAAAPSSAHSQPLQRADATFPSAAILIYGSAAEERPIGAAFLRKGLSNPIFVSVGHLVSLRTAIQIVEKTTINRVPQPIRLADIRGRDQVRLHMAAAAKTESNKP